MHTSEAFDQTSATLAAMARVSTAFVSRCARENKIPFIELPNGVRVYRASDAPRVAEIKSESVARRGRWRSVQNGQDRAA